ncbi:esterase/lipase family protein [Phaeacidiphilus oryzae]|uniref:esterase/lipase family protein n=1 Tax=Phaeacidiphilus oryzae TaxID=348818 RepID=UPI00055B2D42|nr:alpha/beta fold hydrolase [Phaeacidiphilus oryzae]
MARRTVRRAIRIPLAAAVAVAMGALSQLPAHADTAASSYPVDYDFATGALVGFLTPDTPPPGANDWGCKPSAAHPEPVVLVNGTFANMHDNWGAAAPLLANHGYCVFAFDYGSPFAGSPITATGDIAASAGELAAFTDQVLSATGASKVDLVGHSQGGMMPRYYLKNLGGAAKVDKLVGLAPSNNGTTLDGITALASQWGLLEPANRFLVQACAACVQQEAGSPFLTGLNAGGETVPGVDYTVIATKDDEVVTPYTNAFLPAAPNVHDITVQNQCGLDGSDHLEIAADPIAMADVLNALDPAHPVPVPCEVVLPVTGPLG